MLNFTELFPIGSVVLLKGATKKIMIFGVGQTVQETNSVYDYIGVPYPEGNLGTDNQYLFNHDDVEKVIFRGFEDSERKEFLERLEALANSNQ